MADAMRDAILAQVPESGEIEFGQLVTNLHTAGEHDAPASLLRYKQAGVLSYRLDKQENGDFLVQVSRKGSA